MAHASVVRMRQLLWNTGERVEALKNFRQAVKVIGKMTQRSISRLVQWTHHFQFAKAFSNLPVNMFLFLAGEIC